MNNKTNSTSTFTTGIKLVAVLVLLFVSSLGFAQDQLPAREKEVASTSAEASTASESLNFMSWFMGSKQNMHTDSTSKEFNVSNKKQLINSGIVPNRLLLKTFMKKAAVYNNVLV
jgi:hypothetical protein